MDAINSFYNYAYGQMSSDEALVFEDLLHKNKKLFEEFNHFLDKVGGKILHPDNHINLLQAYLSGKISEKESNLFITLIKYKQNVSTFVTDYLTTHFAKFSHNDNIILFDDYLSGKLPVVEENAFKLMLQTDKEFASNFKVYLFTVEGVCREAHQDNLDFGLAIKSLSKEKLKEIIGKQDDERPAESMERNAKPKVFRFRPWMWQAASIAAIVIIAYTVVFNFEKHSRNTICDDIYASALANRSSAISSGTTRGPSDIVDITKLDDSQLESKLPEMRQSYQNSENIHEQYLAGYPLAMAYIRLHQPQPALEILNKLVADLQNDEDYDYEVHEMRLIISLLK